MSKRNPSIEYELDLDDLLGAERAAREQLINTMASADDILGARMLDSLDDIEAEREDGPDQGAEINGFATDLIKDLKAWRKAVDAYLSAKSAEAKAA